MSRGDRDFARFKRSLLKSRVPAVKAGYPLMFYSYSSRVVGDLRSFYEETKALNPRPLLSLYDVNYYLGYDAIRESSIVIYRIFDSGNFEVAVMGDPWTLTGPPGDQTWTLDLYAQAANRAMQPGDALVSFDLFGLDLEEQVTLAFEGFDAVKVNDIRRILLLHPNGTSPSELAEKVVRYADKFDWLGLTEKGLGLPWYIGASYLREVRAALAAKLDRYLPIHVFGCLDPRNLPILFFAGADVFDGLAWARYYLHNGHTYYAREFEHDAPVDALTDWPASLRPLLSHNIQEMEALRTNLQYAVMTGEDAEFEESLKLLWNLWKEA